MSNLLPAYHSRKFSHSKYWYPLAFSSWSCFLQTSKVMNPTFVVFVIYLHKRGSSFPLAVQSPLNILILYTLIYWDLILFHLFMNINIFS